MPLVTTRSQVDALTCDRGQREKEKERYEEAEAETGGWRELGSPGVYVPGIGANESERKRKRKRKRDRPRLENQFSRGFPYERGEKGKPATSLFAFASISGKKIKPTHTQSFDRNPPE